MALHSHYRYTLSSRNQQVAVLIPELVERHRYQHKGAAVLKGLLPVKGNQRIVVINVPRISNPESPNEEAGRAELC